MEDERAQKFGLRPARPEFRLQQGALPLYYLWVCLELLSLLVAIEKLPEEVSGLGTTLQVGGAWSFEESLESNKLNQDGNSRTRAIGVFVTVASTGRYGNHIVNYIRQRSECTVTKDMIITSLKIHNMGVIRKLMQCHLVWQQ